MTQKDLYKILGVTKNATMDDIKTRYKELAKVWHPDKNINNKELAERKFKEISEAYHILKDGVQRYDYDRSTKKKERHEANFAERQKNERVRRMDKEQKEYVRKQEEKRRKAQRMRNEGVPSPTDDADNVFAFRNPETVFNNFFKDREFWRKSVPDIFTSERIFNNDTRSLTHGAPSSKVLESSMLHSTPIGFTDSRSMNNVFDKFFQQTL